MSEIATIQIRKGTAAQWAQANPILANGEPGYITDTGRIKIGNGSTAFANLPFADTKIPDATTSSKGLMTAAQAAQVNTNKNNITTLQNTVSGQGNRLTTAEGAISVHTTAIGQLQLTMPKAHCVRLYLQPDGNEYYIYKGLRGRVLYAADNGTPIPISNINNYKVKLDIIHYVDFIFDGFYNNIIPEKAFLDLGFSGTVKPILIIPSYITIIELDVFGSTVFDKVISFAIEPPKLNSVPVTNKVHVPRIALTDYQADGYWGSLNLDIIKNI